MHFDSQSMSFTPHLNPFPGSRLAVITWCDGVELFRLTIRVNSSLCMTGDLALLLRGSLCKTDFPCYSVWLHLGSCPQYARVLFALWRCRSVGDLVSAMVGSTGSSS